MSLFAPYKAVGYVTNGSPFSVNRLGTETFLTMSIGKSFQVYRLDKLTVCLVSHQAKGTISNLQTCGHETFAAVGKDIIVFNRNSIVRTYSVHKSKIVGMSIVGKTLLTFDEDNAVKVIDVQDRELVSELLPLQSSPLTCVVHPATYINKFVFGYTNGQMELWNVRTCKIIYTFKSHIQFLKRLKVTSDKIFGDDDSDDDDDDDNASDDNMNFVCPSITCMEQSPATDVIGVGFSSGQILLMNLKLDTVLFSFKQEGGAVTSLSFRTDSASDRFPFMVSGGADGKLHIWNLGTPSNNSPAGGNDDDDDDDEDAITYERKLEKIIEDAHSGSVSRVHFLHGEPIMISSAEDNSVKVWIFDAPDGSARLLKSREGHSGFPLRIRYYGGSTDVSMRDNADGRSCEIVSAGSDGTLRLFNTALESQNREMSQNPILKKLGMHRRNARLPVVQGFDFCEARQRDWANLATIHKNHTNVYLWKFKNRVVTEMILRQPHWHKNGMSQTIDPSTYSTAVAMSPCGNLCVVGSRGGVIYKYNVQSGLTRDAFPKSKSAVAMKEGTFKTRSTIPGNILHEFKQMGVIEGNGVVNNNHNNNINRHDSNSNGHSMEVTGVFVNATNTVMVSCGLDGLVIFWDFESHAELHRVSHDSPLLLMQGFRDSGFVAIAAQDRTVRVYDLATFKLSRRFTGGHSREITDIAFSPDGRRLFTSSMDSTMRVWDIPKNLCLSWLSFDAPVVSMAMSHSGEYLCISQVDKEGIFMYVDRSLYETVHFWKEPTFPTPVSDSLTRVDMTDAGDEVEDENFLKNADKDDNGNASADNVIGPSQAQIETGLSKESTEQRGEGIITMAAVPRAYWTNLCNLELIKMRNKASAPPVPPPAAPFFLPTIIKGGSTPSFPTPAEYQELMQKNNAKDSGVDGDRNAEGSDGVGNNNNKKRSLEQNGKGAIDGSAHPTASNKKSKNGGEGGQGSDKMTEEDRISSEIAALGAAWTDEDWGDEDDEDNNDDAPSAPRGSNSKILSSVALTDSDTTSSNGFGFESKKPMSRIINRGTAIARCKLVAYILQEFPEGSPDKISWLPENEDSAILTYLKTLPPPAVDIEFRALYNNSEDEEGLQLLRCFLAWLIRQFERGTDFEVLQAYLYRFVYIYSEELSSRSELTGELIKLRQCHQSSCDRFRHLVQKNLCLLKLLSGLPPI